MVVRQAVNFVTRNDQVRRLAESAPMARDVVRRFIAGERIGDAVRVAGELTATGLRCSVTYLGPAGADEAQAAATVDDYRRLVAALEDADLADRAELSVKLSSLGLLIDDARADGLAVDNLAAVCETADKAGTSVTVDQEEAAFVERVFAISGEVRGSFTSLGVTVQANLRSAEDDCRRLSSTGSRVRLCKGAYGSTETSLSNRQEIDLAFVRCLRILMAGDSYPMIATHDQRMIEIAQATAVRNDRERSSYEIQMLYGIRPDEQKRLAALGERVRVYVPYGTEWYQWLARRLAEKPTNVLLFAKAFRLPGSGA